MAAKTFTRIGRIDRISAGVILGKRRTELGISQGDIAERIGISQSHVAKYEGGNSAPKDFRRAKAVIEAYELAEQSDQLLTFWFGYIPGNMVDNEDAFEITSLPEILERADRDFERNQRFFDGGQPIEVGRALKDDILPNLRRVNIRVKRDLPSEAWAVQERLSKALCLYGQTISYWKPRDQAARELLRIAGKLYGIAEQSGEKLPKVLSQYLRAVAYYLDNQYVKTEHHASFGLAIALNSNIDINLVTDLLQFQSISRARQDKVTARDSTEQIDSNIQSGSLRPVALRGSRENMARVESLLHSPTSFSQKLEAAKKEIVRPRGGYKDNYSGLLLIRLDIEAMNIFNAPDVGRLDELIKESNLIAGENLERVRNDIESEAEKVREKGKR